MALSGSRPWWVPPALLLAALGASVPPVASGVLLMQDVRLGNFCSEKAQVGTERALRGVRIRHFHDKSAFPVGGCVALAVAFGGAAGASLDRRWRRWAVALLAVLAVGGYLGAEFTGKKEAWHTLSPGLSGWSKLPLPQGFGQGELGLSVTRPECDPSVRADVARRVALLYWIHAAAGAAMAVAAAALGLLGMSWRREGAVA
ncbi:MAG: hypothetical protein ACYDCL_10255 [Myxococcales bacterium]